MINAWNKVRRFVSPNGSNAEYTQSSFQTDKSGFDEFKQRQVRYYLAEKYYMNHEFSNLNRMLSAIKAQHNLYRHIRSPFNPTERLVEGYVSSVYGGAIDYDDLRTGAIPIVTSNNRERNGLIDLFTMSNMNSAKNLYARQAAKFGDSFLKVVDLPDNNTVMLQVLDPRNVESVMLNPLGDITFIRIQYEKVDDKGVKYTYTEEIDETTYRTFKNDELYAFNTFGGQALAEWPNPYGFVPVTHAKFRDNGNKFGLNAFFAQMEKINEVNDIASLLFDNIRNTVQAVYHAQNVAKGSLTSNRDEVTRDMIRIIYTQGAGTLTPLISNLNIEGALGAINSVLKEIERDLPVLSLHQVREMSQISSVAVKAMYSDAIKRVNEAMTNLDTPLIKACAMGLAIAGWRGIIPGFGLDYYRAKEYKFSIAIRDVISDQMSNFEKTQILMGTAPDNPLMPLMLETMGYEASQVQETIARSERARQERIEEELIKQANSSITELTTVGNQLRNSANGQGANGLTPNQDKANSAPQDTQNDLTANEVQS